MSVYGFSSEEVAIMLREFANFRLSGGGFSEEPTGREVMIVQTPASPIPAYDGTTISSGDCTMVQIDGDEMSVASGIEVPVLNLTTEEIAADSKINVARLGDNWVAVAGGGGGGTAGTTTYTIVANSGITAAVWPAAGTGTGDRWELSSGGASWSAVGGSSVDVRNPWEETIASGSRMICYKDGDYYVVIQASCPAV